MSGEGDLKFNSNSEEMLLGSKSSFWKSLRNTLNFSIFTNPLFLVVGITNLIACLGLFVPYFYLPNMVEERNFTKEESSFLISAMGKEKIVIRYNFCQKKRDFQREKRGREGHMGLMEQARGRLYLIFQT